MSNRKNRRPLDERVIKAAEAALAARHQVSPIDVMSGLGWLYPGAVGEWRQGRIDCLEDVLQTNPARLCEALMLLRTWAAAKGLVPSETQYTGRQPHRPGLRFSRSGSPELEKTYRTHWISGGLSERKRERLAERTSRAPDLVVIVPLNDAWTCHRCGGSGDLLIMEKPGPACMRCVGLDDLEFLPSGDALLTRRVKARCERCAVVVKFSRTRRRYERQGLLVEPQVLKEVQRELQRDVEES